MRVFSISSGWTFTWLTTQKYKRVEVSLLPPVLLPMAALEIFIHTKANITCSPYCFTQPYSSERFLGQKDRPPYSLSRLHNIPLHAFFIIWPTNPVVLDIWLFPVFFPSFFLYYKLLQGVTWQRHTFTPVIGPVLYVPGWNCGARACLLIIFTTI